MPKNPCAKIVKRENAYEVWQSPDASETYYVLRKYQQPEAEAKNPYAKWLVNATTNATSERGDTGDTYAQNVMSGRIKIDNPLCAHLCITPATQEHLSEMGLGSYRATALVTLEPRLIDYLRLSIPKEVIKKVLQILAEHDIRIVATDEEYYIDACLADVLATHNER